MKSDKSAGIVRVWQMGMAWLLLVGAVTVAVCRDAIAEPAKVKTGSDSPGTHAEELFTLEVLPLLRAKCFGCHGEGDELRGEYYMTSREALLRGGESGEAAVVPGKIDAGSLLGAIRWDDLEMPPKKSERLSPEEIALVEDWVQSGAVWPSLEKQLAIQEAAKGQALDAGFVRWKTSGGTSQEWTDRKYLEKDLWAFVDLPPMEKVLPKGVSHAGAIDFFVDRKIEEKALVASPPAHPVELLRRVSYDLTGLPPTAEQTAAFVKAFAHDSKLAYEELIDQLLSSPRYGERWARHWLDITRYADTGGMSNDYERSNMWRYRDYVIRCFNNDKPYNEFIKEQIAGDELAKTSVRKRLMAAGLEGEQLYAAVRKTETDGEYTEREAELLVASGFLRLGPWDNAMVDEDQARQIYLDDVVNITGQTFLSQTLRCCKCHDHKFDPIPTRDYYGFYAAFATTFPVERPAPFLSVESRERFDSEKKFVEEMLSFARAEKKKLIDKRESAARVWYAEHDLPYKEESKRRADPDDQKPPRHVGLDHVESGMLKVREQDEWIWERRLERFEPLVQSVFSARDMPKKTQNARKLRRFTVFREDDGLVETCILTGGSLDAPGAKVSPGVLSAVSLRTQSKEPAHVLPDDVGGRRTALAHWIADAGNPLTVRSIVNRIWQYHFGSGLAANSNNFGAKGGKPTHPDLLDYLSRRFLQGNWSIKKLHKAIMLSETYRRSVVPVDETNLALVDPGNSLLTHFNRRRLTAEEIRDSLLSVSGELVHTDGGIPVFPEMNMEVALQPRMIQFSLAPAYQPSVRRDERNRRTIFAYHCRGLADPFLELFNQPNPNESCELRDDASVTPQALTLLNSEFMSDRAVALADELIRTSGDDAIAIKKAFHRILGREPVDVEIQQLLKFLRDTVENHERELTARAEYPTEITRSLVEEFSGLPFEYREILPKFMNYEADLKIEDLSVEGRGLADICLLLMNTNEFLFVD